MKRSKFLYVISGLIIGIIIVMLSYCIVFLTGNAETIEQNKLVISSYDAVKEYDGTALKKEEVTLKQGNLEEGHKIVPIFTGEQVNVGKSPNTFTVKVMKGSKDVTKAYNIEYLFGNLEVTKRNIKLSTGSDEKLYDGLELKNNQYNVSQGSLLRNHNFNIEFGTSITKAGSVENKIEAKVVDNKGNDVTNNYNIEVFPGNLVVKGREINVSTRNAEKFYDGLPLTNKEYDIEFIDPLMEGDTISVEVNGKQTEVGESENTIYKVIVKTKDGYDNTENYKINLLPGKLLVKPIDIIINTPSKQKTYDGLPLTDKNYEIVKADLIDGHNLNIDMVASITNIGKIENQPLISITDANGKDVSSNYKISVNPGILEVIGIPIGIVSNTSSKLFDGKALEDPGYELIGEEGLLPGHHLRVKISGKIVFPGSAKNHIADFEVLDENGNIVSQYYDLTNKTEGTLTIYNDENSDLSKAPDASGGNGPQDQDTVVFNITSDFTGNIYLRKGSKATYKKDSWGFASSKFNCNGIQLNPLFFTNAALKEISIPSYTCNIKMLMKNMDSMYPYYTNDFYTSDNDYKINENFGDEYGFNFMPYNYFVDGFVPLKSEYQDIEEEYSTYVYNNYLQIPSDTKSEMLKIAEEQGLDPSNIDIINQVAKYIQGAATYNLDFKPFPEDCDMAVYFLTTAKEGICQHYATSAAMMYRALGIPARYTTGFVANITEPNTETPVTLKKAHAWVEVYIKGMGWINVEVTGSDNSNLGEQEKEEGGTDLGGDKNTLNLKPIDVHVKNGFGAAVSDGRIQGLNKLEEQGFTYECTISGRREELGISYSYIESFTLYNKEHLDVTKNYKIEFKKGILQVYDAKIDVYSDSLSKVYDGTDIKIGDWRYNGSLLEGHYIDKTTIKRVESFKDCGKYLNEVTFKILDGHGKDVTETYYINNKFGYLEITQKELTIESESKEVIFDGTPLVWDKYKQEGLINGDTLEVIIVGKQPGPGHSENKIKSYTILDSKGKNINGNYKVKLINGTLSIKIK